MSNVKTEVSSITNKLAYVELLAIVSYSFFHFVGWFDGEAAHNISFGGVEEENVFNLGIASLGGAEKSSSDRKAKKPSKFFKCFSSKKSSRFTFHETFQPFRTFHVSEGLKCVSL